MRAKRSIKPRIVIVGAGNLAHALAISLHAAGYDIDQILSRGRGVSLRRTRRLARDVEAPLAVIGCVPIHAEVVWFCVPDGAISSAAAKLAGAADWKGKIALHSSGALSSDELTVLRKQGSPVASVHPFMTFVRGSQPSLAGVPFAIEGDRKAVRAAQAIVQDLRGEAFSIGKGDKQAYHAWGMFVSPLLTALLASAEKVAGAAGISRKRARGRMLPILQQTLSNYARLGAPESFSGPIVRGDVAIVEKHLDILQTIPAAREIYIALARAALRDLPAKNRTALRNILKS